jgi:hypothetical protein
VSSHPSLLANSSPAASLSPPSAHPRPPGAAARLPRADQVSEPRAGSCWCELVAQQGMANWSQP